MTICHVKHEDEKELVIKFEFVGLFERVKMPLTVNSPTACGRSPLGEGALEREEKSLIGQRISAGQDERLPH